MLSDENIKKILNINTNDEKFYICHICLDGLKKYIDKKIITSEEIENIYKKSKLDIKKFFNTNGKVYKELELKNKLASMSESEKLELLASNGMLLKRPVLVEGNKVIIGFNEKEYEEKLK